MHDAWVHPEDLHREARLVQNGYTTPACDAPMLAACPLPRNVENRTHGRLVVAHYLITEDYALRTIKLLTFLTSLLI